MRVFTGFNADASMHEHPRRVVMFRPCQGVSVGIPYGMACKWIGMILVFKFVDVVEEPGGGWSSPRDREDRFVDFMRGRFYGGEWKGSEADRLDDWQLREMYRAFPEDDPRMRATAPMAMRLFEEEVRVASGGENDVRMRVKPQED